MIYHRIVEERNQLLVQETELRRKLKGCPPGHLNCTKNGKYVKYFCSDGKQQIYISRDKHKLAEKLAVKKYISLQLKEIEFQIRILNQCIAKYNEIPLSSDALLQDTSPYNQLLQTHFLTYPKKIDAWIHEKYERNASYPEHLIHKTMAGHYVRSKSEVMIANMLYTNHIPYRYECKLQLGDFICYPDFTICHPETFEIFYWEHFGMMDKDGYRDSAYNKMKLYGENEIIPTINLIATYETQEVPIDSGKIQRIVEEYFL